MSKKNFFLILNYEGGEIMSSAEEISKQILYMICELDDYKLIGAELSELRPHYTEIMWGEVGDLIRVWFEEQFKEGGRFHGSKPNIFEIMNVLDFNMQVYEFAGENAMLKKFSIQFELANIYSDQGGLGRKFELYEKIVSESYPLIKKRDTEDKMHYYFTRSLNRLAELTQYWKGKDESVPLWKRLAEYAQDSSVNEKKSILNVVRSNAPSFAKANQELFENMN